MKKFLVQSFAVAWLACGGSVLAETLVVGPGDSIQAAVKRATKGDTILVNPGTYRETIYIDKDDIHLKGVIKNGAWPILDGDDKLNDGILASGHGVVIERMWVRRFKGNGIMTQGANNFRIVNNVVEGPCFYAIFPQFGRNGLVANNIVWKSHDAAIYVGMSDQIDVLDNEAHSSIIGIEIENSTNALVEGNYVHNNSVGLGAAKLPGLPVKVGNNVVFRRNVVVNNNAPNIAPSGAISASIPPGVGVWILGFDDVVIENNLIRDNNSVGILHSETNFLISAPDAKINPLASRTKFLGNFFLDNGKDPHPTLRGILAAAGRTDGVDLLTTGKGLNHCIVNRDEITSVGASKFSVCAPDATSMRLTTARSATPVPQEPHSPEQRGRLAYLAVCSGCHTYDSRLIGPPMVTIKALYGKNAQKLADYMAKPVRRRPDLPEMPPQDYLAADLRLAIANYILNELSH